MIPSGTRRTPIASGVSATCALLFAASLIAFWPGILEYDTVNQFEQVMTGQYDDWHPPVMARLWSLFEGAGLHGSWPMLVLQLVLFWGGLAGFGVALARRGRPALAWCVPLVGLLPVIADWMAVVMKDTQFLAAMVAATGVVAWFRLAEQPMPRWASVLTGLLLGYAVLLRANSMFAVVPLAWGWQGWAGLRNSLARLLLVLGTCAVVIVVSGWLNHRVMQASRSGVEMTLPKFDLAGIGTFARLPSLPGVVPSAWQRAVRQGCYTPFFWDPFGEDPGCQEIGDALEAQGSAAVYREWLAMIARHPVAYARHRLAHLNATLRFAVPAHEDSDRAPETTYPNRFHVGAAGGAIATSMAAVTDATGSTPLGSPLIWLTGAIGLTWTMLEVPPQPARELGLTLLISVCIMTVSFAVISIASDIRYHLWLFVGTLLAAILLARCEQVPWGRLAAPLSALIVLSILEILARDQLHTFPM